MRRRDRECGDSHLARRALCWACRLIACASKPSPRDYSSAFAARPRVPPPSARFLRRYLACPIAPRPLLFPRCKCVYHFAVLTATRAPPGSLRRGVP